MDTVPPSRLGRAARRARRTVAATTVGTLIAGAALLAVTTFGTDPLTTTAASTGPNPITPGNVTGYGFDQCEAPSQAAMTAWRKSSPFRSAGIYISGSLRYCQKQTNLTPDWVRTQLATGWHLLPIHLGAQANCTTRDRYQKKRISADPANDYAAAKALGKAEARVAVVAATKLGIVKRSTLFYDLEAFSIKNTGCRISSLKFLSAWTQEIHAQGYVSGVYSSAASGIKILDDARVTPGNTITLPDQIWIADWNKVADTNSTYIRSDGWPGKRIHQYQGGHDETWGGVRINIDRNYLDLRGNATTPTAPVFVTTDPKCSTGSINSRAYRYVSATYRKRLVIPLQCLLKQQRLYAPAVTGTWNPATTAAVLAWQKKVGHRQLAAFSRADWITLLAAGNVGTTLKPGAKGADVVRAQRALNAANEIGVVVTGVYDAATRRSAKAYQARLRIKPTEGIIARITWSAFAAGRR